jgi:hypothetical protein
MAGDKGAATKSYQLAIELWKNADVGFRSLEEAKRELAALKQNLKVRKRRVDS